VHAYIISDIILCLDTRYNLPAEKLTSGNAGVSAEFKIKYLSSNGDTSDQPGDGRLEVSATLGVSNNAHDVVCSLR